MGLEISEIKDRGTEKERVIFTVDSDCDIGKYFVFVTNMTSEERFSISVKYPFWFPDKKVTKGDLVVLYTKKGTSSYKLNSDSTTTHFYYRKLDNAILTGNVTLLVEAKFWKIEKT